MKIKIAIIGSKMPVNDVCEVIREFPEVDAMPMICHSLSDTPALAAEVQEYVDVILFGGPVPYSLSQHVLTEDCRATFIPFEGPTVYNALMKVYMTYNFLPIISFEAREEKHVDEIYEEIGVSDAPRFIKIVGDGFDREAFIRHHLQLWKERKIQVIVTGIQSVYEHFQQLNIPVFIYKVTKQTIRDTIKKAILMGMEKKKHLSQFTVLQFLIDETDGASHPKADHAFQQIKQKILEYGNRLYSCSGISEDNLVTLYTTRGILEKITNNYEHFTILNEIKTNFPHTISLGIGMGDAGDSAAQNASNALLFAKQNGGDCVFLIDENKRLNGPLGSSQPLEYALVNVPDGSFVSITIRRFYAWLQIMKKTQITAQDIRTGMNVSDRHAARILKTLQEQGFANVIGKESMSRTGRPRPIYEIDLEKLAKEMQETQSKM